MRLNEQGGRRVGPALLFRGRAMACARWSVIAAGLLLIAAGCSSEQSEEGDLRFLGLRAACVPNHLGAVVVSPGEISLVAGESLQDIGFQVEDGGVDGAEVGVALAGVEAGDAVERSPLMELLLADAISLTGPGQWPIVVTVQPGAGQEGTVQLKRISYVQDGRSLHVEQLFELSVAETCQ
jgi:hypothetical protein